MWPFSEHRIWLRAVWGVFAVLCGTGCECLASPSYTITDLGAVPGDPLTGLTSYVPVLGVNSAGQGYVRAADGSAAYAFQRSSVDHGNVPNVNAYLPALFQVDYLSSSVINTLTINSQGWAIGGGLQTQFGSQPQSSFLYKPQSGWADPGDPGGGFPGSLTDINSSNTVAGSFVKIYSMENGEKFYTGDPMEVGVAYYKEFHAAILDPSNNKWLDLNAQLPAGSGWFLTQALKIDDLGQIVGVGTLNGVEHEFLLTPGGPPTVVSTPEPGPLAFASLVALGMLCRRLRSAS